MSISVTDLRDHRLAISNATVAYVSAERDLFQRWGPTAVRHLYTDDRRRLARLAHDLGWRRVKQHARIVTVAALLMGPDGGFVTGSDMLMDGGVTAAYWYGELAPRGG